MKRLFLASLGIVCLGLALATAQTINKSVQLTNDASGLVGVSTPGGIFFPDRIHGNSQLTPSLASSTGTGSITGTDLAGEVIEGTGASTGATVTFTRVQNATPYCTSVSNSVATPVALVSVSPAGFQVSHSSNTNTTGVVTTQLRWYYTCISARAQ